MDVADVPLPGNTSDVRAPATTRCTVHVFEDSCVLGATPDRVFVESGSTLRIADSDWPPAVLFDAGYAVAVLKRFGARTKASVDELKRIWGRKLTFDLELGTSIELQQMQMQMHAEEQRHIAALIEDGYSGQYGMYADTGFEGMEMEMNMHAPVDYGYCPPQEY